MIAAGGYTAGDVARLLDLPVGRVRAFARMGLVDAARGPRREYRFSFQDLVLLRVAKDLARAQVPQRRIRRSLQQLKETLPHGRSLSGLQIAAEDDRVVVHDGDKRWNPESGQLHFRFDVADLARRAAPLAREQAKAARDAQLTADDWYEFACEMEAPAPADALDAYRRALALDAQHADAHTNLGRLLHEAGELRAAESHYRRALEAQPGDATPAFNLGVVLEDQGSFDEALQAYERAVAADPEHVDAHLNAAGVCERLGRHTAAVRHLQAHRKLTSG